MLLILRAFDSAWIVDGATYSVFHQTPSGCRFTLRNGRDKLIFQISSHWVAWSSWGYHIFADLEITTRFWTVFRAPVEFELHFEICFRPINLFWKNIEKIFFEGFCGGRTMDLVPRDTGHVTTTGWRCGSQLICYAHALYPAPFSTKLSDVSNFMRNR